MEFTQRKTESELLLKHHRIQRNKKNLYKCNKINYKKTIKNIWITDILREQTKGTEKYSKL